MVGYRFDSWFPKSIKETPPKVVENGRAKNLWDTLIQTDKSIVTTGKTM